jgi:hypothetical protein
MFHVKHLLFLVFFIPIASCAQKMGTTTLEVKSLPSLPVRDLSVDNFLLLSEEYKQLSDKEKDWFYWTNYSRINPRRFWDSVVAPLIKAFPKLDNSYSRGLKTDLYNSKPLPMVKPNKGLSKIAQSFAKEMAANKALPSHSSPSGSTFQSRMESGAIKRCAGENISFGPDNPIMMLALLYIDEGVPDMGHRKTLLDPAFEEMGLGIGSYPDKKIMVVQDFACNQKD